MTNNMSTFKRYEKKYMVDVNQYNFLRQKIKDYTQADKYDKYTISNIYYDTDTYEIIRRSIEKPVYKEKLRLRSYGTPDRKDEIFIELKKKYKKEVFKRRVSMSVDELETYLKNGMKPNVSQQVMNEIEYFMSMYKLYPKIFIAYERSAFVAKNDSNLRITFDENIRFRNNNLNLCEGDYGETILSENQYILEVKMRGAMPLWLSNMLTDLKIYPTSFSKYGYCYKNFITKSSDMFFIQHINNKSIA